MHRGSRNSVEFPRLTRALSAAARQAEGQYTGDDAVDGQRPDAARSAPENQRRSLTNHLLFYAVESTAGNEPVFVLSDLNGSWQLVADGMGLDGAWTTAIRLS